jgi:hypothetical protein
MTRNGHLSVANVGNPSTALQKRWLKMLLGFQSTLKGIRSAIANDFQARDVRFTTKTLTPVQEFKHFFKSSRPKFELLTLLCHFKTRCELTQRYTRLNNYQPTFSP